MGFVVCKCWPNDTDNLCHWRLYGNNMAVDKAGFQMKKVKFYRKRYHAVPKLSPKKVWLHF